MCMRVIMNRQIFTPFGYVVFLLMVKPNLSEANKTNSNFPYYDRGQYGRSFPQCKHSTKGRNVWSFNASALNDENCEISKLTLERLCIFSNNYPRCVFFFFFFLFFVWRRPLDKTNHWQGNGNCGRTKKQNEIPQTSG